MSRMRDIESLPTADPGRERDAREMFPLATSPEEYAARHAHDWYCFSFDDYRYADPVMERWIHRLGDILFEREGGAHRRRASGALSHGCGAGGDCGAGEGRALTA